MFCAILFQTEGYVTKAEGSRISAGDFCDCNIIHEDVVESVRGKLMSPTLRAEMADFYKIMGDNSLPIYGVSVY